MQRDEMMTDNGSDTKCAKCNLNFTSAKTLKNHQLEKHSQNVVKCFKCGLKFINSERFRAHWNSKHVTAKIPAQSVASTVSFTHFALKLDFIHYFMPFLISRMMVMPQLFWMMKVKILSRLREPRWL